LETKIGEKKQKSFFAVERGEEGQREGAMRRRGEGAKENIKCKILNLECRIKKHMVYRFKKKPNKYTGVITPRG
jgi:hypothetical protein